MEILEQRLQQRAELVGVSGLVSYTPENMAIRIDPAASDLVLDAVRAWERDQDQVVADGAIRRDKDSAEAEERAGALLVFEPDMARQALRHYYNISSHHRIERTRAGGLLGQLSVAVAAKQVHEAEIDRRLEDYVGEDATTANGLAQ